jgi:hypothetical protein
MPLEKYQSNAIFRAIEAGGLAPDDCVLTDGAAEVRIRHVPSGSLFILGGTALRFTGSYTVGASAVVWPYDAYVWTKVPELVQRWAGDVKRDLDTPDLWADLRRRQVLLTSAGYEAIGNTPFTPDEQLEVAAQLLEIKVYVKATSSLTSEQTLLVEAWFNEAEAATRRLGRKDWLLLFLGVVLSSAVAGVVPPDAVHHLLTMVSHALGHLFGGAGGSTQLPPAT